MGGSPFMQTLLRVFTYLRRYPGLAAAQLGCAMLMALLIPVPAKIIGYVIDKVVIPGGNAQLLVSFTLVVLGVYFLKELLNSGRILVNNIFEQRVIFDLRSDLYDKIQRLPLDWFDTRRTGDIMTRVIEDVTAMERALIDGVEQGLTAVLQIAVIGGVLFYTNSFLGLWATLPLPLLATGAWLYSRKARNRYKAQRDATSDLNSILHDNISGIRQIKAYAAEPEEHRRFNRASDHLRHVTLRLMRYWAAYSPGMNFISTCGFVLVLGIGGSLVLKGEMRIGELTAFFLLISLFYDPVRVLHQLNQMFLSARAAGDRVFEILDTDDEVHARDGSPLPNPVCGAVTLTDVSFSYGDKPTLDHVSIHAEPGETIALVGSTGAGKSTIVSLLTRFYEYDSGSITVDGMELNSISKASLRSSIGYVTQEPFLFNGTVRENMELARRSAPDADIWAALDAAHAADFVRKLPKQLDTNVGERGVKLSGGEKQRLSIARALLKDPPILLLDEATASVDSQTEHLIQGALDALMRNRTSFVIAHRLSTIRNADRIYVLERGKVIEAGTHADLLAAGGKYTELCQKSFLGEPL